MGPYRLSLGLAFALVVAPACGQAFSAGSGASDAGSDGSSGSGSGSASSSSGGGSTSSSGSGSGSSSGSTTTDAGSDGPVMTTCQGSFHCVPGVPVGWSGPVELYDGTVTPPACDSAFSPTPAYDGNDQLSGGPATCGCDCGGASGVQCAPPTLSVYSSASCGSSSFCASHMLAAGQCTPIDFGSGCSGGPTLVELALPDGTPTGGSCAPQSSAAVPATSWSVAGRACNPATAPVPADCPAQAICAPKSSAPYFQGLCVMRDGDVACPTLGYSVKHLLYSGVDDTRSCTTCTCGNVAGSSCSTTLLTFLPTSSCGAAASTFTAPITCSNGVAAQQMDVMLKMGASGGACTPSGGQPTGAATPAGPRTFCCLP